MDKKIIKKISAVSGLSDSKNNLSEAAKGENTTIETKFENFEKKTRRTSTRRASKSKEEEVVVVVESEDIKKEEKILDVTGLGEATKGDMKCALRGENTIMETKFENFEKKTRRTSKRRESKSKEEEVVVIVESEDIKKEEKVIEEEEGGSGIIIMRKDYLSEKNKHERDEMIEFIEEGHRYIIKNEEENEYRSVTTVIHENFTGFDADKIITTMMAGKNWKKGNKYWGMTGDEIKESWAKNGEEQARLGTNLHYDIECFLNIDMKEGGESVSYTHQDLLSIYEYEAKLDSFADKNSPTEGEDKKGDEWNYFLNFLKDTAWYRPYRTEWRIYHEELKIAGSIDMVYENDDGTLSIYDWKRAKDITRMNIYKKYAVHECLKNVPDTNFFHYSLQLNFYKYILENKYNKKIKDLYLVRLHPNNKNKTYDLIKCKDMTSEIKSLVANRLKCISEIPSGET